MLQVGKQARPHLPFTAGDGTQLPFADDTFDAVTISFGLRNIVDPLAGLREMRRVTKPGGRLVVCEFSHPTKGAVPHGLHGVPHEGAADDRPRRSPPHPTPTSTSPSRSAPGPTSRGLAELDRRGRLAARRVRNLSGGIVALHRATA